MSSVKALVMPQHDALSCECEHLKIIPTAVPAKFAQPRQAGLEPSVLFDRMSVTWR